MKQQINRKQNKSPYRTELAPNFFSIFICIMVFGMIAGCSPSSPDPDSVYNRLTEGTLKPGDTIPAPQEQALLRINGLIEAQQDGDLILMDLPMIESVGLVEYTVEDPFEEKMATFQGVLMQDMLNLWQIHEEATALQIIALNDYQVEVPLSLLQEYPVIFAIQRDGEYMKPSYRGPAMLVFPYDHFEFDRPFIDSYWIWQIKSITVK